MRFEWVVALRFLREGRFQTALIIIGASVGVAVVIFITTLVTGLQANTIKRVLGAQAHIVVTPRQEVARVQLAPRDGETLLPRIEARTQRLRSIDQWQALAAQLERTPGITAVSPIVSGAGFAQRGDASKAINLIGIDPVRHDRIIHLADKMVAGRFVVQPGDVVIGRDLAADLGAAVGDRIRLQTAQQGGSVSDAYTITGLFDLGSRAANRTSVYVGFRTGQSLLDLPGGASEIDLTVADLFGAEELAQRLAGRTGLTFDSWMKTFDQLVAAIRAQDITTVLIRLFVVLIVALGIASVLVVWVVQKRREIGILRAMGASRAKVQRVFLLQGAIVAVAGSTIGSALSSLMLFVFLRVARNADGTPLIELKLSVALYLTAALSALAVGLLAAAVPARTAARLDPAQAIRS
jgi:lipoprotein-releasing system permease protein